MTRLFYGVDSAVYDTGQLSTEYVAHVHRMTGLITIVKVIGGIPQR